MRTRLLAVLLLFCFALTVSIEAGSCATSEKKFKKRHISEYVLPDVAVDQHDHAQARGTFRYAGPGVKYGILVPNISLSASNLAHNASTPRCIWYPDVST